MKLPPVRSCLARDVALACLFTTSTLTAAVASTLPARDTSADALTLLKQAEKLPSGFAEHFFNVPLAVRIDVDGKPLGSAMVILTPDETVRIVHLLDQENGQSPGGIQRWLETLKQPRKLGACKGDCPEGLLALHYNLADSVLSIATAQAESLNDSGRFHTLPEAGSSGFILQQRLNLSGGAGQSVSGRLGLESQTSVGNWTLSAGMELARSGWGEQGVKHRGTNLFAQREIAGHFFRAGFFTPAMQGLTLSPNLPGTDLDTTLGVMAGSSDALLNDSQSEPALYPVHITADRQGTAEVYRNGVLIYSQQVPAGVHPLDTRQLPGGVYDVEIRLTEDGTVISREAASIYKPTAWRDTSRRWRYSVFAGQRRRLFDSMNHDQRETDGDLAVGAAVNYLVHPRVVLGGSLQRAGTRTLAGAAIQWQATDSLRVDANVYQTSRQGTGVKAQAQYSFNRGNVTLSHSRAWIDNRDDRYRYRRADDRPRDQYRGAVHETAASLNYRLTGTLSANTRITYQQREQQAGWGADAGTDYTMRVGGHDARWRLAVFDRPTFYRKNNDRNRGVELSLAIKLGKEGERVTTRTGTRTGYEGQRDRYATVEYLKDIDWGPIKSVNTSLTKDSYGIAGTAGAIIEHQNVRGDVYGARSSYTGKLSGGLNLSSTLAIGAGHVAVGGQSLFRSDAGMIVDVETDVDDLTLSAQGDRGGASRLKRGRNFVPVSAYRAGTLRFDFEGNRVPTAQISPTQQDYHLNQGGVAYTKIKVARTIIAMGRLVDHSGKALASVQVASDAGSAVTGPDGFFALDVFVNDRTLTAHTPQGVCKVGLPQRSNKTGTDGWIVGRLTCPSAAHAR